MTEKTTPSPASVARAVDRRRDYDARQTALHQGLRTVSEHYDRVDNRVESSAARADEVVKAAEKYLAFLTGDTPSGPPSVAVGETPDGLPVITIAADSSTAAAADAATPPHFVKGVILG